MTILFDLDGVVLDTEPGYSAFWHRIGQELFPDVPDFAARVKGNTLRHIFDTWFAHDEQAQAVMRDRLRQHENQMSYPFHAGAQTLLRALQAQGHTTAIVTSSSRPKMAFVLKEHPELPTMVARIFTAEDATASKPSPAPFLQAAEALHVAPADCIVVEDSENGLKAARAAGMNVLGLLTTTPREIVARYAHHVEPDLSSVTIDTLRKTLENGTIHH